MEPTHEQPVRTVPWFRDAWEYAPKEGAFSDVPWFNDAWKTVAGHS